LSIKADSGTPDGDRKVVFDSVISSSTVDSHYEQFGPIALRQMAAGARSGVKILPEHNHRGQPIGKTMQGAFNNDTKEVTAKFYLQRGLNLRSGMNGGGYASSDDYIAAAEEGTTDRLSVGARVEKQTCNFCGEEMKPDPFLAMFGIRMPIDSKGHYPGQTIYTNKKGEEVPKKAKGAKPLRITSTIEKAELMEVSLVAFGANPDAEITAELQKAYENGELSEEHLEQLNDRFAIKVHNNQLVGGVLPARGDIMPDDIKDADLDDVTDLDDDDVEPKDAKPPETDAPDSTKSDSADADAADDVDGGDDDDGFVVKQALHNLSEERRQTAHWQGLAQERSETIHTLNAKIEELETGVSEVPNLRSTIEKQERQLTGIARKEARIDKELAKITKYDDLCKKARDMTLKEFIRANGGRTKYIRSKVEQERQHLDGIEDFNQILGWYDIYYEQAEARSPKSKSETEKESLINLLKDPDRSRFDSQRII